MSDKKQPQKKSKKTTKVPRKPRPISVVGGGQGGLLSGSATGSGNG